jgi:signal transduction histidine kinase
LLANVVRLAPQSLFGRLLAALLAVVGVTLTVIVILILQDRRDLALRVGGVWNTSHRIAEITSSVSSLKGPQRAQEIERLTENPVVVGQMDFRILRRRPDMVHLSEKFADQVRKQLGKGYKVTITPAQPENRDVIHIVTGGGPRSPDAFRGPPGITTGAPEERFLIIQGEPPGGRPPPTIVHGRRAGLMIGLFDVNVSMPDGQSLVFRVAPPWPEPPLPVRIFLEMGILTLALGVALLLTTRSITRPLSNLARAADAVGRSVRHPRLVEEGAREIRDATRAFNAMQDRLLRYLDSRTRVLAAMSHDLKTPLTRLRLRVESVSDADLRDRFSSDLDEMESLVHGALGLFKGLDDDETFEAIDVNALLGTIQTEFTEMGAQVSVSGQATSPVPVKPRALKRCLTNLVENAVKFGSKADLFVEDGLALVIRVRDDGPGIPAHSLEQVFEPFFRLESSRSRDTGGTGLGLTIARDVAQAHGGTLILNNLPERGLEAVLTIPRTARDDDRIPHRVRP